jgi:hypothetical protein
MDGVGSLYSCFYRVSPGVFECDVSRKEERADE